MRRPVNRGAQAPRFPAPAQHGAGGGAAAATTAAAAAREDDGAVTPRNVAMGIVLGVVIVLTFGMVGGRVNPHDGGNAEVGAPGGGSGGGLGIASVFGGGGSHSDHGGDGGAASPEKDEDAVDPHGPLGAVASGDGHCKCARHCIEVGCRKVFLARDGEPVVEEDTNETSSSRPPAIRKGHSGEREASLLSQSIEFSRCRSKTCTLPESGGAECVAESVATERARCSPAQRHVAKAVRDCLVPTLRPPQAFTLERDSVSGLNVVCRGDVPIETCRSLDAEAREEFEVIRTVVERLQAPSVSPTSPPHEDESSGAKEAGEGADAESPPESADEDKKKDAQQQRHANDDAVLPDVHFVDLGDTDGLLDMRVASLPHVTVHVLSANPEQRNVAQLSACVNHLLGSRINVKRHAFTKDKEIVTSKNLIDVEKGTPVVLRMAVPGYEEVAASDLQGTITKLKPQFILATGDAAPLSEFFITEGYVAWNPRSCRFATSTEAISTIGLAGRRRATSVWVRESKRKSDVVPRCAEACMVPMCHGGWRTDYRPCTADEFCTSDELVSKPDARNQDNCYYKMSPHACKRDPTWMKVLSCSDPNLPVAPFSIIDVRGVSLTCKVNARECLGVDVQQHDFTMNLLNQFFNQISDTKRFAPEYVSVGAFVGNVGFAVAKLGYEVHLFEPVPATRQWLKITKCFSAVTNAHVYDFGIGPADEECAIAAEASALEGNVNVTCPAPPRSLRGRGDHSQDVVVPFRTLDTVYRHLRFEGHGTSSGTSSKTLSKGFVLHFDESVDPLPLLQVGTHWLKDADWNPAVIVTAGNAPEVKGTTRLLKKYGYNAVKLEGAPTDWAGHQVYVASNKR